VLTIVVVIVVVVVVIVVVVVVVVVIVVIELGYAGFAGGEERVGVLRLADAIEFAGIVVVLRGWVSVIDGETAGLWPTVLSVAVSCDGDDLGTDAGALLGDVVLVDFLSCDSSSEGSDEREFVDEHCNG
jgi:hypothetical protein